MENDDFSDYMGADAGHARPPLSLRQIEVFRTIMVAGSISNAGRALHVSQPAISRVLALTESRLGYLLFERSRNGLHPTPEARRLYTQVEEVYNTVQRVNSLAASLGSDGSGQLKIISSATFGQKLIPQALASFRASNQTANVDHRNVTFDEQVAYFLSGQADIGISMNASDHPHLSSVKIGEQPIVCIVPKDHQLASREVITPNDFTNATWIGYPQNTPLANALLNFFGERGANCPAAIEVRSPVSAYAFVLQGLGPALVDRSCLPGENEAVIIKPISPAATIEIWVTRSNLSPLPLLARRFVAALKKTLAQQ